MRFPLSLISLFTSTLLFTGLAAAQSGSPTCNKRFQDDPVRARAIKFLQGASGQYQLGSCQIELHMCEGFSETEQADTLVGDMLIVDRFGHESYIPLDFGNGDSATKIAIQNGRIMFHYDFDDRHRDSVAGRTESIRLEILKTRDLGRVKSIHAGLYSTNEWIARKKRFTYYWSICEDTSLLDL